MPHFDADDIIKIGVLDLQGCVFPHQAHIEALGAQFHRVKSSNDFTSVDALILPGGESSTMLKNLANLQLWNDLQTCVQRVPVWGICAGAILMANKVSPEQQSLKVMDVSIHRNAYGRQLDSKHADINGLPGKLHPRPHCGRIQSTKHYRSSPRRGTPCMARK